MRNCFVSAPTPRTFERATTLRLFRRKLSIGPPRRDPAQARVGVGLARLFRIAFRRIPLELVHWINCLREVRRADMLVVAGTGIVCDYLTGPTGYPYQIFKLSTLAALCRVKLAFLSVGVGPIHHPLSRWLIKRSLAFAYHRSYRDETSKQYVEDIGFNGSEILSARM